jgi:spermidine/putrescine-binding protein
VRPWLIVVLALALAVPSMALAQPGEIVFSGYGGDYGEQMKKLVIGPFEKKFGVKVVYDATGSSAQKLAKLRATKDTYTYDVTVLTGYDLLAAGREGLLEAIGADRVPNLAKLHDFAQKEGEGWGPITSIDPLILLYNRDKVKPAPDSWTSLWDPKYKGKVAISHVSEGKGLFLSSWRPSSPGATRSGSRAASARSASWCRTWVPGSRSRPSTCPTSSERRSGSPRTGTGGPSS